MRYAIADPPYLGRGARLYGPGTNGRRQNGNGAGGVTILRTTEHPNAAAWDDPATHHRLIAELIDGFDGWAVALARDSLACYLAVTPPDARVAVWHRLDSVATGSRIRTAWEPVILFVPPTRRARGTGPHITDVMASAVPHLGHIGAKPRVWTRWVLDLLGVTNDDTVTDIFGGSGMVANEIAQTVIEVTG